MNKNFKDLPLRSGVGIVLLNKQNKVFVAKRIDNPKNFWQMPQGGVDEGEDYLTAAYRELKEETSMKDVELVKELDGMITYELPEHLLGIIWKGKYRGQKQKWFLMKYLGNDNEINLKTNNPEFLEGGLRGARTGFKPVRAPRTCLGTPSISRTVGDHSILSNSEPSSVSPPLIELITAFVEE